MEKHKKQRQLTLGEIRRGQIATDLQRAITSHSEWRIFVSVLFLLFFYFGTRFCRRQRLKTIRCDWRHRWDFSCGHFTATRTFSPSPFKWLCVTSPLTSSAWSETRFYFQTVDHDVFSLATMVNRRVRRSSKNVLCRVLLMTQQLLYN